MEEKIIALLKKHQGYLSGEELSQSLGVSRQALWKHIQFLKELGFDIAAVPHLGYRLVSVPDRLYDFQVYQGLETKIFGKKILYFDSLSSTMDMATQLALKGADEGTVVLSETQVKGRGRLGRIWNSPKYKGLYFSLILRPKISLNKASLITLLAGVGICEAIKESTREEPKIKWPNDIVLNDKKLGGILTEIKAEVDEVDFIVIGVGLNINNDKKSLISGATSLRQKAEEGLSRLSIFQNILFRLENNYFIFQKKGASVIAEKWRQLSLTLGKRVKVYSHREHIDGEAVDIDSDGGLLVRCDSGLTQKVTAGDVVHCR
ncbi:MAG: biotin--[acetyl-CoA-carboxylase] ligase [Candidatus Omnitrophica bacterium]|nr:biotin--[acetyl-CoA-carboxylase] ligase [Candidatus Omnitrophota bacterium]